MAYDEYYYGGFRPYVSAAARRAQAARELAKLQKKGRTTSPVVVDGRKIAATFWGKAWCDNLERYSDYANRLPRGRTYVRNGSVVDLQVAAGSVAALVSGSSIYEVKVTVAPVAGPRWSAICQDCSGAIDSLVELLQGRFSNGVMTRLCEEKTGLFPSPRDITFTCSCPDWASMCKHVAAVLYGIGARLDRQPELLFTLRRVDHQDLIARAGSDLSKARRGASGAKVLESDDLSAMFGIEIAPDEAPARAAVSEVGTKTPRAAKAKAATVTKVEASPQASGEPPSIAKPATRRPRAGGMTPANRKAVSTRMKAHWAAQRVSKQTSAPEQPAGGMTPANRKAVSARMKAHWAERRAAKQTPAPEHQAETLTAADRKALSRIMKMPWSALKKRWDSESS